MTTPQIIHIDNKLNLIIKMIEQTDKRLDQHDKRFDRIEVELREFKIEMKEFKDNTHKEFDNINKELRTFKDYSHKEFDKINKNRQKVTIQFSSIFASINAFIAGLVAFIVTIFSEKQLTICIFIIQCAHKSISGRFI